MVQGWVNGSTANDGLIVKANPDAAGEHILFDSSESASGNPRLTVDWSDVMGSAGTAITKNINDKCTANIAATNGNNYISCTE